MDSGSCVRETADPGPPYGSVTDFFWAPGPLSHPRFILPGMDDTSLSISCGDCVMQHTDHCHDCIVTFICDRDEGDAVVIDVEEQRALRLLIGGGLVPGLRHVKRTG